MKITIENLKKAYDEKIVIDNLSLTLEFSKAIAIMGESGCGKTTLLRIISGIEKADSGKTVGIPNRISYMFQEDRLLPWLTAFQNVKLVGDEQTAKKYLTLAGLRDELDALPNEMSGGMQRRVSLARALCFSSDLIILDEPFKGINDSLKEELIKIIQAEQRPVILVTHDKSEALLMAEKIISFKGLPLEKV